MSERSDGCIRALDAIDASDPEAAHGLADELLLGYVSPDVRLAYMRVIDRCKWWGTA